ncbi:MAG: TRAP transporter substrate-binding protein DctP [Myxococcales bacterium]|jgi:TRAP-type C4-dicarboxylate transport system substrate-binding protein
MRRLFTALALALVATLVAAPVQAAKKVTIKLGTMAPDGSAWHNLLKEMGEKWSEASNGQVKLKVYPGGVAGNEGDMVRKLRVGQLQAAALTVVGLHDIETSPQAIATPGLIANDEEWNHVFAKMAPLWESRFAEKGFIPLMWGDTGWIYLFLKKEAKSVADLKGTKVFAWAGDNDSVKGWVAAGFQPVVISSTDILPSLTTGMIEGYANTPIMAFTARWYEQTPYMIKHSWGHLPGGTIVSKQAWEKIPEDVRPKLLAIAREYGEKVNREVNRMQAESIAEMQKQGLKLITFEPADQKLFVEMAEKTWPMVRGGVCTAEAFDEVKRVRDEFRASKGKQ